MGFLLSPTGPQVILKNVSIPNAWVLSTSVVDKAGHAPTAAFLSRACPGVTGSQVSLGPKAGPSARSALLAQMQHCLSAIAARCHGVATYQPASRYWPFQAYETMLFAVLALALAGLSLWWVRHRLT